MPPKGSAINSVWCALQLPSASSHSLCARTRAKRDVSQETGTRSFVQSLKPRSWMTKRAADTAPGGEITNGELVEDVLRLDVGGAVTDQFFANNLRTK